ncbi:hypothetical protein FDZ84_10935 [Saccharopolyspora sp. ASAGF58]|nr:hypothetical protein FDZ84_10935 [Saccharopolyspora sp. ASAGF58]
MHRCRYLAGFLAAQGTRGHVQACCGLLLRHTGFFARFAVFDDAASAESRFGVLFDLTLIWP